MNDSYFCPGDKHVCLTGTTSFNLPVSSGVVTIASGAISCVSSAIIVSVHLKRSDRDRFGSRSILVYLAIADLITSFSYISGSANYLVHKNATKGTPQCDDVFLPVCKVQAFVTSAASMASFLWTIFLTLYFYLGIVKDNLRLARRLVPLYHVVAWGLPTLIAFAMLAADQFGYASVGTSHWCFVKDEPNHEPYQWIYTALRILVGMKLVEVCTYVVVVALYIAIRCHLRKFSQKHLQSMSDYGSFNQHHSVLGKQLNSMDRSLILVPVVFIALRMWGTINIIVTEALGGFPGCIPEHLTQTILITLSIFQAVGDGGQGWGNGILYLFSFSKCLGLSLMWCKGAHQSSQRIKGAVKEVTLIQ